MSELKTSVSTHVLGSKSNDAIYFFVNLIRLSSSLQPCSLELVSSLFPTKKRSHSNITHLLNFLPVSDKKIKTLEHWGALDVSTHPNFYQLDFIS